MPSISHQPPKDAAIGRSYSYRAVTREHGGQQPQPQQPSSVYDSPFRPPADPAEAMHHRRMMMMPSTAPPHSSYHHHHHHPSYYPPPPYYHVEEPPAAGNTAAAAPYYYPPYPPRGEPEDAGSAYVSPPHLPFRRLPSQPAPPLPPNNPFEPPRDAFLQQRLGASASWTLPDHNSINPSLKTSKDEEDDEDPLALLANVSSSFEEKEYSKKKKQDDALPPTSPLQRSASKNKDPKEVASPPKETEEGTSAYQPKAKEGVVSPPRPSQNGSDGSQNNTTPQAPHHSISIAAQSKSDAKTTTGISPAGSAKPITPQSYHTPPYRYQYTNGYPYPRGHEWGEQHPSTMPPYSTNSFDSLDSRYFAYDERTPPPHGAPPATSYWHPPPSYNHEGHPMPPAGVHPYSYYGGYYMQAPPPPPHPQYANESTPYRTRYVPYKKPEPKILRKKFSWKHYAELEQFLIDNREEYLAHSQKNYTAEQKQYNNWLTEQLIKVAESYNYVFDKEDFNFVGIRDRIRCYYKSYVQTARKRGVMLPGKANKRQKTESPDGGSSEKENEDAEEDSDNEAGEPKVVEERKTAAPATTAAA